MELTEGIRPLGQGMLCEVGGSHAVSSRAPVFCGATLRRWQHIAFILRGCVVHETIESQGPLDGRLFPQYFFIPPRANAMILFYVHVSRGYVFMSKHKQIRATT